MTLRENLESLTTSSHGLKLPTYVKIAGIKTASKRKEDMVNALYRYLSDGNNIIYIWENLDTWDRQILEEFIRTEGNYDSREIVKILKNHNQHEENPFRPRGRYGYGIQGWFYEDSKAQLFFIKGKMINEAYSIIKRFVSKIEVEFTPVDIDVENVLENDEAIKLIEVRESFQNDFVSIIKLVNSSKLKTTKASAMPNKVAIIKMNEVIKNKEILHYEQDNMSDIRVIDDTTRLYGVSKLLLESGILKSENENLLIGNNAEEFLGINIIEKCELLLGSYIDADVDELKRITELKLRTEFQRGYSSCRETILEYLKKAPIDKWIRIEQFFNFVMKNDRNFLRKEVGETYTYDDYERYYYPNRNDWEDEAGRFIEIVLLEYLSAIGIVDLLIRERENGYGVHYFRVKFLKLTPLGAHVLGVNNDYCTWEMDSESGIAIAKDCEIMVMEGNMKEVHSLYLDRFAEKIPSKEATLYKLSFKAMVTALDNKISIEEIIEYLDDASNGNIPKEALVTLEKWREDSKKIRIRTVTIVETSDENLLQELKSIKSIKNSMISNLSCGFEIDSKAVNKVKKNIENAEHFCIVE